MVLSADCKGIVMRPGALRAATAKAAARLGKMRTRLTAGEKPNRKRMAALVTVYDAEPTKRVAVKALEVLAGDSSRAAEEITAQAGSAGLPPADEPEPTPASGVIEGACRHLIAGRLDIGGARWGLDGAEAVLTLRAVISNGDFEEYWRFHLAREHQRLYPGTKQGQYTLGACRTTSLQRSYTQFGWRQRGFPAGYPEGL